MFTSSATVHSASSIHMMVVLTSPQLSTVSLRSEQIYEQTGDHAQARAGGSKISLIRQCRYYSL